MKLGKTHLATPTPMPTLNPRVTKHNDYVSFRTSIFDHERGRLLQRADTRGPLHAQCMISLWSNSWSTRSQNTAYKNSTRPSATSIRSASYPPIHQHVACITIRSKCGIFHQQATALLGDFRTRNEKAKTLLLTPDPMRGNGLSRLITPTRAEHLLFVLSSSL
jgi:hypothetical protein